MNAFPIREVVETLESVYVRLPEAPRFDPMDELVSCILSQQTTDAKSFPTFFELRKQYPDWQAMVDVGQEKIAEAIKQVGLANQKSKTIYRALQEIRRRTGSYSLEVLREM